jgi:hypothetical protein
MDKIKVIVFGSSFAVIFFIVYILDSEQGIGGYEILIFFLFYKLKYTLKLKNNKKLCR